MLPVKSTQLHQNWCYPYTIIILTIAREFDQKFCVALAFVLAWLTQVALLRTEACPPATAVDGCSMLTHASSAMLAKLPSHSYSHSRPCYTQSCVNASLVAATRTPDSQVARPVAAQAW
jgi:hypothetical protein